MIDENSFLDIKFDVDEEVIEVIDDDDLIDLIDDGEDDNGEENPKKIIYFDLETQISADEVKEMYEDISNGWSTEGVKRMKMSIGSLWIEPECVFKSYTEDRVDELIAELYTADVVVGFNVIGFDYTVLMGYCDKDFTEIPTVDMLLDAKDVLGHRLKLDSIAKGSLKDVSKSADGLAALRWFKEGKIQQIQDYCEQDVAVTRDVYKYGDENNSIKFDGRYGLKEVDMKWTVRVGWNLDKVRK